MGIFHRDGGLCSINSICYESTQTTAPHLSDAGLTGTIGRWVLPTGCLVILIYEHASA